MGRNGAGKSTLLRHAAGLLTPTRGRVRAGGRVGLLLQSPGDYLVHERVGDEASAAALEVVGLTDVVDRHPRDLSGGQRQRLALAIVMDGAQPPACLCLDEPTRGMDRAAKGDLADRLHGLDAAVVVATHDPEFAVAVAERVVLLADGRVIADGPAREVLAGGWYFATETARVLGGLGGALTPEEGAELLARATRHGGRAVTWAGATFALLFISLAAGYAWYERAKPTARLAAMVATMAGLAALGRIAFAPVPNVKPTTDIVVLTGYVLGGAPGFAVGATGALASNVVFGQGPWTPWQMAAWGLSGLLGAALGAATGRRVGRVPLALFCGAMGLLFGAIMDLSTFTTFSGERTLEQYLAIAAPRCRSTSPTPWGTSPSAWPSGRRSCARWSASARA